MTTSTLTRPSRRTPRPTTSPCGPHLDRCTCRHGMPRTAAEVEALHRASVQRAHRSAWHTSELLHGVLARWWSR